MRPSYLYNGNPYTGKAVFLYRNSARVFCINPIIPVVLLMPCVPTCLDAVPTLACAMAPQCLGDRCERDCLSGLSYEDRIMPRDTNAPSDSEATLYTALISICFYPDFLFMERNSEQHPSNWTPFEYLVTNFVLKLKLGGGGGGGSIFHCDSNSMEILFHSNIFPGHDIAKIFAHATTTQLAGHGQISMAIKIYFSSN